MQQKLCNKNKLKQADRDKVIFQVQVFRRHKTILDILETVEDEHCSGRPVTSQIE